MASINTLDNLRSWFRACPALAAGKRFGVDYLGESPTEYAIYTVPSQLTSKTDILGNVCFSPLQTFNFIFASRSAYGADVLQNLANCGFFDEVTDWIYAQNQTKNFPVIREGTVESIMPSLTQYVFEAGTDAARYQIQCKITYRRND